MDTGDTPTALERWEEARRLAPEVEEVAYWQAFALADDAGDIQAGAELLIEMLAGVSNRGTWIDLVRRLGAGGYIERKGVAEALLARVTGETRV